MVCLELVGLPLSGQKKSVNAGLMPFLLHKCNINSNIKK